MNTDQKFYLSLAACISLGVGVSIAIPVLSQPTSRPSNYLRETVALDAGFVQRVTVFEDRKRNRVCYLTYASGGRDHAISCVILDQNNPR